MGGFHYFDGDKPLHPLSRREVERLVARGKLVPPLEDEIKATSKAGTVSKAYAILQTLWFVTQCIARPLQRLPITEFEVVTLAYTIMIIGMYGFWWSKPFGTERPIAIQKCISGTRNRFNPVPETPISDSSSSPGFEMSDRTLLGPYGDSESVHGPDLQGISDVDHDGRLSMDNLIPSTTSIASEDPDEAEEKYPATLFLAVATVDLSKMRQVPTFFCGNRPIEVPVKDVRFALMYFFALGAPLVLGIAFGAIHFISWSAHFDSSLKMLTWRWCSIVVTILPTFLGFIMIAIGVMVNILARWIGRDRLISAKPFKEAPLFVQIQRRIISITLQLGGLIYIVARYLLIGIAIADLFNLPKAAFEAIQWTQWFPHL
ncbi:hypothetical protein HWV62_15401 [Athelia sp. TMB]|nr:hypothetical protein HWV62_15401 [Athelia sp. TMB]